MTVTTNKNTVYSEIHGTVILLTLNTRTSFNHKNNYFGEFLPSVIKYVTLC